MRKTLIIASAALTLPGLTLCQLVESEKALIAKLDTSRVVSDLQRFSTGLIKTKSGLGAGTAVVGNPEERLLADAVEAEMKKLRLKTHQEKFPPLGGEVAFGRGHVASGRALRAATQ